MILLLVSFVAGILTVLAPCILPLLPIIVGGSLTGEAKDAQTKKVITIVVALAVSIIIFTLLLKASTLLIDISPDVWKWISGGIVTILGVVILFPKLWEGQILARISAKSNILIGEGSQKKSFCGDVTIGAALGPVFSNCSITYLIVLATVLPAQPILGIIYLIAYVVGLSLALFVIAFIGQKIMSRLNIAADPKGWFKRILGILFILVGLAIIFGYDKKLEAKILDGGYFDVTQIEQRLLDSTME
jgi:cytochrome c biogenesis protein CcdA